MSTPEHECDCLAAKEQLDAFRRRELTDAQVRALADHLGHCRDCHCMEQYEAAFLECLRRAGGSRCCPEQLRARLGELLTTSPRDA